MTQLRATPFEGTSVMAKLLALFVVPLIATACSFSTQDPLTNSESPSSSESPAAGTATKDCKKDGQGFTGGATVPLQIFGSYGPGKSRSWDVEAKEATGTGQNVQMATGLPNGIVTILWGENAEAGDGTFTVECTIGWATYNNEDPKTLWQSGIIFDEIAGLGTNTFFCHHIEMDISGDDVRMKMWETYWKYGTDYTCPDTLKNALDGKSEAPNPVTYLELPATGIGAKPVPPAQWTTGGDSVGVQP